MKRNNVKKRIWLLVFVLIICLFSGCNTKSKDKVGEVIEIVTETPTEVVSEEPENDYIDVVDYLEDLDGLVNLLGMNREDSGMEAYQCEGFSFSKWSSGTEIDNFQITNTSNMEISIYGCIIGTSISELNDILLDKGWFYLSDTSSDVKYNYGSIINNCAYDLHITVDSNGNISNWFINNWFDVMVPKQLEDLYYNSLEEWQRLYISFVEKNYLNEFSNGKVSFVYIDGDDIPEMIIETTFGYGGCVVCTIKDGVVNSICEDSYSISYVEESGYFKASGGQQHVYSDKIYLLANGDFSVVYTGEYGALDASKIDNYWSITSSDYIYFWNDTEVSENEYQAQLNAVFDTNKSESPYDDYILLWEVRMKIGGEENPYPHGI